MKQKGMTFTVENRKGGVGKTASGVNLAHGLALRLLSNGGGNVLLVDLDPQGDASRALGLDPGGRCVSYVLTGEASLADSIMNATRYDAEGNVLANRPNLFVLPASDLLRDAKEQLLSSMVTQTMMASMRGRKRADDGPVEIIEILNYRLGKAKEVFDYIILDCPPTLDMLQEAVHNFADAAIVPVKVDFHGTSATGRHTQNILDDQAAGIDISIMAVVPTFVNARHNLTVEMLQALVKVYGRLVTKAVPNTVRMAEAPQFGSTIYEYQPDAIAQRAKEAYDDLVNRVYTWRKK